jgi:hypothetical protein
MGDLQQHCRVSWRHHQPLYTLHPLPTLTSPMALLMARLPPTRGMPPRREGPTKWPAVTMRLCSWGWSGLWSLVSTTAWPPRLNTHLNSAPKPKHKYVNWYSTHTQLSPTLPEPAQVPSPHIPPHLLSPTEATTRSLPLTHATTAVLPELGPT